MLECSPVYVSVGVLRDSPLECWSVESVGVKLSHR